MTLSLITPSIVIPENNRVYAFGDIHGHLHLFEGLLELAKKDLCDRKLRKGQDYTFAFLGDNVDHGLDSKGVLDRLCELKRENPNHVFMDGNHDADLLSVVRFLSGDKNISAHIAEKIAVNQFETYRSYGVKIDYRVEWEIAEIEALTRKMPQEHRDFLETLHPAAQFGKYILVHDPIVAMGKKQGDTLNAENAEAFEYVYDRIKKARRDAIIPPEGRKIIVHGHMNATDTPSPERFPHRIGVNDSDDKILHCAVLEQNRRPRFLSFPQQG